MFGSPGTALAMFAASPVSLDVPAILFTCARDESVHGWVRLRKMEKSMLPAIHPPC